MKMLCEVPTKHKHKFPMVRLDGISQPKTGDIAVCDCGQYGIMNEASGTWWTISERTAKRKMRKMGCIDADVSTVS
jgi:hypothetical protein